MLDLSKCRELLDDKGMERYLSIPLYVQPLSTLVGLHMLDLSKCRELLNVHSLSLHTLSLRECHLLDDVRPLSVLVGLHMLVGLGATKVRDVPPLLMRVGLAIRGVRAADVE
jgi:hypothetical protein